MCYMTKCPYVPPHPWNVDFPHLMLRAKAVKFRRGETHVSRQAADRHRPARQARDDSGRGAGGQRGQPRRRSRARRWNRCSACIADRVAAGVRDRDVPQRRAESNAAWPVQERRAHAGQGGDLLDLLRELQRARHRPRPARGSSSTTRFRTCSSRRKPAAACPSSSWATSRRCAKLKDVNIPRAGEARARRLRDPDRGAVLHADVQAGAAAAVSRRTPTSKRCTRRCSIRSSTWCCATRTAC